MTEHESRQYSLAEDLEYWRKRGAQISWRIENAKATLKQMELDLDECFRMICELKREAAKNE